MSCSECDILNVYFRARNCSCLKCSIALVNIYVIKSGTWSIVSFLCLSNLFLAHLGLQHIPTCTARKSGHRAGCHSIKGLIQIGRQTSTHAHIHTYRQFRVSTLPGLQFFECRSKPEKTHTNVQTRHRKSQGSNLGLLSVS